MSDRDDITNELCIGKLLLHADSNPLAKRVISVFNHDAKRTVNVKAFSDFNLDMLEPCAEFLNIDLANDDGNKLYTKDSLVNRIVLQLRAFLPAVCLECSETYATEFDGEKPLFHCHMCFRGSHDCASIKNLHTTLANASLGLLSGHVWLCRSCVESSVPIKPRKSRTKHESGFKSTPSLSRIHTPGTLASTPGKDIGSPVLLDSGQAGVTFDTTGLRQKLNSVVRERVCQKYRKGKCPHGLRGNKLVNGKKCEFEHPKYCNKYCRHGTHQKLGCSKSSDCRYYHPILCKHSLKRKLCTNTDCTFIHLKGTRRKEKKPPDQGVVLDADSENKNPSSHKGTLNDHFLELRRLVELMQTNFLREIADIRSSLHAPQMPYQYHVPRMAYYPGTGMQQFQPQFQTPPFLHSQKSPNVTACTIPHLSS